MELPPANILTPLERQLIALQLCRSGHIVLDGVPALRKNGTAAPFFMAHVYCCHGRQSQLLLSSCLKLSKWKADTEHSNEKHFQELECGPMPNVMVALPNIGGALC